MNETNNAILILIIVICSIVYISIIHKKQNNEKVEAFTASYQDVKTKTLNWCSKMQKVGLLNSAQFDKCQNTFKDVTSGVMPKAFKAPDTGMERTYSLYNTRQQTLNPNVSGENSNTVMLVSNEGLYMACKPDNTIYFITDINDPAVNQNEIYFTLLPQNANVYIIMSPYGKYLLANQPTDTTNTNDTNTNDTNDTKSTTDVKNRRNGSNTTGSQDWTANFTGISIGTMVSWTITKVSSNNTNKVTFESVQLPNFFLSSTIASCNNSLTIIYGHDDSMTWQLISKPQNIANASGNNDLQLANTTTQYIVTSENIIASLINSKMESICLQAIKDSLVRLEDIIRGKYINIQSHMQQELSKAQNIYTTSNSQYNASIESLSQSSTISKEDQENITNNIPIPIGFDISNDDIQTAILNISNKQNYYLKLIDTDINGITNKLNELKQIEINAMTDYKKFLIDIKNEIDATTTRITQSNTIMDRQQTEYNKLNEDYSYIDNKKEKAELSDTTTKINTSLITDYNNNKSIIIKAYPYVIVVMILCVLYLGYNTIAKFQINIYNKII